MEQKKTKAKQHSQQELAIDEEKYEQQQANLHLSILNGNMRGHNNFSN